MEFYQSFVLILVVFTGIYLLKITPIPPTHVPTSNTDATTTGCPNILYAKNGKFYLINTNKQKVDGINPIVFGNLEKYIEFLKLQQDNGINCPVLYAQYSTNAQGDDVAKIKSCVMEPESGTPSGKCNCKTSNINTTETKSTSNSSGEYLIR